MHCNFSHSTLLNLPTKDTLRTRKEFYREALEWRSLAHDFILPLLGIFEENDLFLVSPLMMNGTIIEWRKNQKRDEKEIYRLVRF